MLYYTNNMIVLILIFVFLAAIITAILEIQIEGPAGWAKNLPTWRSNPEKWYVKVICFILNKKELTGYHLAFWLQTLLFFHAPLFWRFSWNISLEAHIIASFLLFMMLEDFLWFVFNPAFGIKKFQKQYIPWHKNWLGPFPRGYYTTTVLVLILYSI